MRWLALTFTLLLPASWAAPAPCPERDACLTWSYPTQNCDGSALVDLASFPIERQCDAGSWLQVADVPASTPAPSASTTGAWTDVGVGNTRAQCDYRISAKNTGGEGSCGTTGPVGKGFVPGYTTATYTWRTIAAPPEPSMASHVSFALVNDSSSGTDITVTGVSVQAGDLIVFGLKWEDGAPGETVADNAGGGSNVYTERSSQNASGNTTNLKLFSAIAKATETLDITGTLTTSQPWRNAAVWVARPGSGKTFAYDNQASAFGNGSTGLSSGSYSVAGVGGYAVAMFAEYTGGTLGAGSGWTINSDRGEYRVLTTETSIEGDFTYTGSSHWAICSLAFKEESAGGSAAAPPKPRTKQFARLMRH